MMKKEYSRPDLMTVELRTVDVLAASAAEYRFIRTGQETDAGSEKAEWGDLWSR